MRILNIKSIWIVSIILLSILAMQSCTKSPELECIEVVIVAEMPLFPGCDEDVEDRKLCADRKMLEYIYSNLIYPPEAIQNDIEGAVNISFTVGTTGTLHSFTVENNIGFGCEEEALKVIQSFPDFIPGKNRCGDIIEVKMVTPVQFRLD